MKVGGSIYFVLLIPSVLLGCYVKVNAVEIPQYWKNYIATLLRKYDFSAAGKVVMCLIAA